MASLMVILFIAKRVLFLYLYIGLLKLKVYKLFENNDADLSWLLFKEANLYGLKPLLNELKALKHIFFEKL